MMMMKMKMTPLWNISRRRITGGEIVGVVFSIKSFLVGIGVLTGVGGFYWWYTQDDDNNNNNNNNKTSSKFNKEILDYDLIRSEIRSVLYHESFDDGCCAPLLLRLTFNQCATYSRYDGLGGSNGASIRFNPELSYPYNRGLGRAMEVLEKVKKKYPNISYSDLWVLASYVAIEEMGGPYIEFRGGRKDFDGPSQIILEDRFPEWDTGATIFGNWLDRMGLTDREGTCLLGAHSCGRLHASNSGIEGTWLDAQVLTNDYYKNVLTIPYAYEKIGFEHYYDPANPEMILLPIEGALQYAARFLRWAEFYAYADLHVWLEDFGVVWKKVTENGCHFDDDTEAGLGVAASRKDAIISTLNTNIPIEDNMNTNTPTNPLPREKFLPPQLK